MSRRRAAQRPRATAEARPDAKADIRSASRVTPTTPHTGQPQASTDLTVSADEAKFIAEVRSWLSAVRRWFDEQLDGTGGEIIALRHSDAERIRLGLTNCAACLEGIAAIPPGTTAPPEPELETSHIMVSRSLH